MKEHPIIIWCRKNGLSQYAFAAKIGASRQKVAHWTTGRNLPRSRPMEAIRKLTGITYEVLASWKHRREGERNA